MASCSQRFAANYSVFELDEEQLANMREYALANSLYWALSEGHACEISARRNAMDVSLLVPQRFRLPAPLLTDVLAERLQERW
jgi:hypothetical protein